MNRKVVAFHGNVGAGKTTLLRALEIETKGKNVAILVEPIDVWTSESMGDML